MSVSTIVLMVWVFLVSISARGWLVSFHLGTWIFIIGIAYIVVRICEWLGIINREPIKNQALFHRRAE